MLYQFLLYNKVKVICIHISPPLWAPLPPLHAKSSQSTELSFLCYKQLPAGCFTHGSGYMSGFPSGSVVKNPPANAGDVRDVGSIPGSENPLKEGMATHSSTLAWRIPWTEELGGLQSMGLQRAGHDWGDLARTQCKCVSPNLPVFPTLPCSSVCICPLCLRLYSFLEIDSSVPFF